MGLINFLRNYYAALRCGHLSKDLLLKVQMGRFRHLLRHAVKNSVFYKELYSGIDIENCQIQDLPVVTKSAMMDNFDRIISDSRLKLREIQEWVADGSNYGQLYLGEFLPLLTSGSSGENALVVYSRAAISRVQASLFARHPLQVRRSVYDYINLLTARLLGPKARIATISVPRGNLLPMVMNVPSFHQLFAKIKILSVFDPLEQSVAGLNDFQPDCLMANSFYLGILAQEQLAGQLDISFNRPMSFIAGGAEPLTDCIKDLVRKAWNRDIQDDYGATECYFMATSCQKFGSFACHER